MDVEEGEGAVGGGSAIGFLNYDGFEEEAW